MTQAILGSTVSLWRYPVKSMMGEERGLPTKRTQFCNAALSDRD
jgi:uncharacterized protein YcbX